MEAKELMIGDWVLYRGDPIMIWEIDEYYDRVNTEPDGYNGITCVEISDINPIPLTPEILEKNGWFPLDEYRYEGDIALAKGRDYFRLKNTTICINSVHELQHTLRLCGIDKEITI